MNGEEQSVQVAALELQRLCAEQQPQQARVGLQQLLRALEDRSSPALQTVSHLVQKTLPRVDPSMLRLPSFQSLSVSRGRRTEAEGDLGQRDGRPTSKAKHGALQADFGSVRQQPSDHSLGLVELQDGTVDGGRRLP